MLSRRSVSIGLLSMPFVAKAAQAHADDISDAEQPFFQLSYPAVEALDNPQPFGYSEPTEEQKEHVREILAGTPSGPKPIDIMQSFVDRFFKTDPDAISQWPEPAAWNPLVVEFFRATTTHATNDMIAWCAASANWCIERAGLNGSRSAGSQSFLSKKFARTKSPQRGDLAVFTCYKKGTQESLGLGHVTFFKEKISDNLIRCVGGNQSADGRSSIISEKAFITSDRIVHRHVGKKYVPCTMRLNSFIRIG
ncbi:MAG TPA: CHAP domain-containing protein [Rhizobiaceae bacterium]|nr:CHAP domain-containing protein [Rhizobiaceae bacterium]